MVQVVETHLEEQMVKVLQATRVVKAETPDRLDLQDQVAVAVVPL